MVCEQQRRETRVQDTTTSTAIFTVIRCQLILLALLLGVALRCEATPASGYWWNPAEPARGFVIEVQGNTMFMAGFLYDSNGGATWVGSTGAMTSATQYSGTLLTYAGGQTLTGVYQSPATTPSPGNIAITFSSDTAGSLTWPGGTIPIERFDIVPGGSGAAQPPTNPQTGWWWNSAQGGRGFAVEVQNNVMYFAGYMYDGLGNPVWYLASGTMTSPTLFQGTWTQFGYGQTLTGSYQPASLVNANVGSVTLAFANNSTAALTLPDGSQIALTRFSFGYSGITLAAFSPVSAVPTEPLQVSGTGFDPAQTVTLNLFDGNGYTVTLPPVTVTTTSLSFSVPAYVNPVTSLFASGTVSLQATQTSGANTLTSNTLADFQIQALPTVGGTPGQSTLALLVGSLAEAQRLQTAIVGTPQNSPTVQNALATQVTNLQTLVSSVQGVVQEGQSFSLGEVGGVNITVNSTNIADVDNLILATLQAIANPGMASSLHSKSTSGAGTTCLAAEAAAFAQGATSGSNNLSTLAQALLKAPSTSAACAQPAEALGAFRIFTGPHVTALAVVNRGGFGVVPKNIHAAAMISALLGNASAHVALNAEAGQATAAQRSSVKAGVSDINRLELAYYDSLLPKTTGPLLGALQSSQAVSSAVAPPVSAATEVYLSAITAQFSALSALTANPAESPGDPALLALFDAFNFIYNGQNLNAYLSSLLPAFTGGIQFTDVAILSATPATAPTTATVLVTVSQGGSPRNFTAFIMNNVGGVWLIAGNGQQAQAQVTTFSRIVNSGVIDSGLNFVVKDLAPAGISYAIVQGQGLPAAGVLLVNGNDGNAFYLAQPPYLGTGSLTPALDVGTPGRTLYPMPSYIIATIGDAQTYTVQLWKDNGTPSNTADDILVATYTSTLSKRPHLQSELYPAAFATVTTSQSSLGNFARVGGSLTVRWTLPAGKASEYVNFFRTFNAPTPETTFDAAVAAAATSVKLTTTPPGATVQSNGVNVVVQDPYLRELWTQFSGL
jgi:hypothetical protein